MTWLALVVGTVVIIFVDHRRRLAAARAAREPLFDVGSPWAYFGLALISGELPLPVYFHSTRKTKRGLLVGIGWLLGLLVVAVLLARILPAR